MFCYEGNDNSFLFFRGKKQKTVVVAPADVAPVGTIFAFFQKITESFLVFVLCSRKTTQRKT